jgi:hypothetical protein
MSRLPKNPDPFGLKGCYIAGGSILSIATKSEINDYDVYPKSPQGFDDVIHTLHDSNCFVVNISDRAITYKSNTETNDDGERTIIQVMTYDYFDTPEKIFENFDFTVCMGAFDCDEHKYILHDDFYPDIATKTLRFNPKTRYPLNSLLRVSKYQKKGYFISKPESTKLALTIAKAGMPNSWEELEAQIGGSYGREIELSRKDMEFSFDNAIELLSDMVFDFDYYCSISDEDYHDIPPEDIVAFYNNHEKIKYVEVVSDGSSWNPISTKQAYFVYDGSFVGGSFSTKMIEKFGMPEHFDCVSDTRLYGYKVLSSDSEGNLIPPISPKNGVIYSLGEETVWDKSPYLYVFKTKKAAESRLKTAKNAKMFLVSFESNDMKHVSMDEIQVKKLIVEKEIVE